MSFQNLVQPEFNDLTQNGEHQWDSDAATVQAFGICAFCGFVFCLFSVVISTILASQLNLMRGLDVFWFIRQFEIYITLPEILFNFGIAFTSTACVLS